MCILFIAIDRHSSHPLIVAANRDEFHARPSEAMHHWPDFPAILAGRDRQAGGTWLGLNRRGRFAAVTNIRTPGLNDATAQSRGELVARFLRDQDSVADFSAYLADRHNRFNPFNLVYGSADELYRFSSLEARVCRLGSGFHSISNGAPDDQWPKMSRGVASLRSCIESRSAVGDDDLLPIMRDRTRADPSLLPNTGVDAEFESRLSSIFVEGSEYGTRTTTLVFGNPDRYLVREINYDPATNETGRLAFDLRVERH